MSGDDPRGHQAAAADPKASAWVSANAGAGKTHVLKTRVLRLLLSGTRPERILCLTYTKAAAAEMEKRVFDELARWATFPDAKLRGELLDLLGRQPGADEAAEARRLFARAIETPGGLKVETIHAFCQRILQQFPLEAFVSPGFSILDDATAERLLREAIDDVLLLASGGQEKVLAHALETVVAHAQGDRFDELIRQVVQERAWLALVDQIGADANEAIQQLSRVYRAAFGLTRADTPATLERAAADVVDDGLAARAARVLADGTKTDQEQAQRLAAVVGMAGASRIAALEAALLTKKGEPRAKQVTKAIADKEPGLADALARAADTLARNLERRDAAVAIEATLALLRLANAVRQRLDDAKAARGALDFQDLIVRTVSLLTSDGAIPWVLYKLDGGIDHILVDEAQDTSPEQWRIVEALAAEFFADRGARTEVRTLFAVGDEKQSIYSFQGADPANFRRMGDTFARAAKLSSQDWRNVSLRLSYRTVEPVLAAVDRVFADPVRTPGLAFDGQVEHIAHRSGDAGRVEVWEPEPHESPVSAPAFNPLDETGATSSAKRLAERVARTIKQWIDDRETIPALGRPIRPGDVMILVRRRRPFAPLVVSALKACGIPVAGADRIVLTEQLAVQDLVALGRVLALPEDDLSLAAVLKSPIFDLDDDALIALAPERPGSLYKALLAAAHDPRFEAPAGTLKRWRQIADFLPPFELFTRILDADGVRRKLLLRLGVEAAEAIDEFLALALSFDEANPPSLASFLHALGETTHEIKRDLEHGRDEVRVLTVHGAKGLEAPIVILPDTCASPQGRDATMVALDCERPQMLPPLPFWPVARTSRLAAVENAKQARKRRDGEETNRLLYVAMTRARDRLVIAGWEGARGRASDCWYDTITAAIGPHLVTAHVAGGAAVRRIDSPQTAEVKLSRGSKEAVIAGSESLPDWASRPPRPEPVNAISVAPSRLAPLDVDAEGEPATFAVRERGQPKEPPAVSPQKLADDHRFLRGTLTHALLQYLPGLPSAGWEAGADRYIALRSPHLGDAVRRSIVRETFAILNDEMFAPVFGPGSRAEVPIAALIPDPTGRRPALRINGQIDRLISRDGQLLVIDYKTNRPPPADVAGVPAAYLLQMAAYRMALRLLFPKTKIEAALVWTHDTRLMALPAATLDAFEPRLWDPAASP